MLDQDDIARLSLPADLIEKVTELARILGEPPDYIVIAAIDHFTILPPERQKAVLAAAGMRRRG